jgi:hypothetical protein
VDLREGGVDTLLGPQYRQRDREIEEAEVVGSLFFTAPASAPITSPSPLSKPFRSPTMPHARTGSSASSVRGSGGFGSPLTEMMLGSPFGPLGSPLSGGAAFPAMGRRGGRAFASPSAVPSAAAIDTFDLNEEDTGASAAALTPLSPAPSRATRLPRTFSLAHGADDEAAACSNDDAATSPSSSGSFPAMQLPPASFPSPSAPPAFGRRQASLLRDSSSPSASPKAIRVAPVSSPAPLLGRRSSSGAGVALLDRASPIPASAIAPRPTAGRVRSTLAQHGSVSPTAPTGASSPTSSSSSSALAPRSAASPPQVQVHAPRHGRTVSALTLSEGKEKSDVKKPVQRGFGSSSRRKIG